jgi:hypothetical protein
MRERGEALARHAGEGVERVRLPSPRRIHDVVEERAELRARERRRLVRDELHDPLEVELGRERGTDALDRGDERRLVAKRRLA